MYDCMYVCMYIDIYHPPMHISDVIWHSFAARFLGLEAGRHPLPGSRSRWVWTKQTHCFSVDIVFCSAKAKVVLMCVHFGDISDPFLECQDVVFDNNILVLNSGRGNTKARRSGGGSKMDRSVNGNRAGRPKAVARNVVCL